mmetsp:Transcript_4174/g.14560  ORF Transcript_4174/g.14560 Transcript_4174/m.14560 type:complete len:236 (-) Transcript_4174:47-754(-)
MCSSSRPRLWRSCWWGRDGTAPSQGLALAFWRRYWWARRFSRTLRASTSCAPSTLGAASYTSGVSISSFCRRRCFSTAERRPCSSVCTSCSSPSLRTSAGALPWAALAAWAGGWRRGLRLRTLPRRSRSRRASSRSPSSKPTLSASSARGRCTTSSTRGTSTRSRSCSGARACGRPCASSSCSGLSSAGTSTPRRQPRRSLSSRCTSSSSPRSGSRRTERRSNRSAPNAIDLSIQ